MSRPRHAAEVQDRLLAWYATNGRDLPWRHTRDPYAILVAEVMLQQTGVDRVIPKWHAWLARFPTLFDLAAATQADAIRAWQGLGYNMRALRLHTIARQVVADGSGDTRLPTDLKGLRRLKGIGRYTAGAVACFAYEQPVAMVDTNVRRVLSRVFDVSAEAVDSLSDVLVPPRHAYPWNQALMDLGALVCRARAPACLVCPLLGVCKGPRMPLPTPRGAAAHERFADSRRYIRGRLIDALRALPVGQAMPLAALATAIGRPTEQERVAAVARGLARDGLLEIDASDLVRLPA